ncbi:MAG: hypothetical protein DMG21_15800 [Acidobacteria bacterium]|nr:MAG: hypothetical protein DMG21_15800 [Acidobacteriota bacterium]
MKRVRPKSNELRPEYKRSDFKKLERGKYYERIRAKSNVVVLDPEVAAVFPNSAAVNKALHSLVKVAVSASARTSGSRRRSQIRRPGA